jgi:hypothetical protein
VSARPVEVTWTWLSTNAGVTKPPSRSTTRAAGNCCRPTSSVPSHATTPSGPSVIASAVASGIAVL